MEEILFIQELVLPKIYWLFTNDQITGAKKNQNT